MIKKGGPKNGTPLPEWTVSDDGAGMLSGTLKIFLDGNSGIEAKGAAATAAREAWRGGMGDGKMNVGPSASPAIGVPAAGDAHPFDKRLICYGTSTSFNSMGYGIVEANYVGLLNDPTGIEWELSASTSDESIETHPDFLRYGSILDGYDMATNTLSEAAPDMKFNTVLRAGINPNTKGPYWNLKNVYVDGPTQSFKGFRASEYNIEKRLIGVESYKVPVATIRVSYTTMNAATFSWAISSIGTIYSKLPNFLNATIPFNNTTGTLNQATNAVGEGAAKPVTGGKTNLLLTSVSVAYAAKLYKVSIEFARSGIYGWNPVIYRETTVQ